jgi:acylphosphatase
MKLKITITGHKVHDVGYRVFLLKHAMNLALPGLSTYNWEENGQQAVITLVEGDEARITIFRQMVEKNKPELAEVSGVACEDYEGEVGRASEVAMFCSFVQLDKAIPLLLNMNEKIGSMNEKLGSMNEKLGSMNEKIGSINDKMDNIIGYHEETNAEIQGLRDDLAIRNNIERQKRMEKDIRIIKSKIGIR